MRTSRVAVTLIVLAAIAAALGWAFFGGSRHAPGPPAAAGGSPFGGRGAMPVPVTAVVQKSVPLALDYVATTEAVRSVALQAKVTGYLTSRGAADGADVKAGDLLYRIDPRDYQAALDQAKAQLGRDAAQREYAEASERRNAELSKNGDVSVDTYQQSQSALHQADAAIAADRAAIEIAQLNLGYTELRAPFAGRLGRSLVHEGALISAAGTQLNTLVQLDPIYVTFNPPSADLAKIVAAEAKGPVAAEVLLGDDPTPRFTGTLSFLDNTIDRSTGTIVARATVANPQKTLLPGQFARIRLRIGELPDALLVPQDAIGTNQFGRFVYVAGKDNKAEQRMVQLGEAQGPLVVVTKGVALGDRVIVGNLQKLGPGAPVAPKSAPPAGGS